MAEYRLQIDFEGRTVYVLESFGDRPTISSVSFRTRSLEDALKILATNLCNWLKEAGEQC